MKEYIEREALIRRIKASPLGMRDASGCFVKTGIIDLVKRQPAADVVEVVRCKDCKHNVANWQHDELDATDYTDIVCDYFMTDGMCPTDYCSYGAKMDGKGEGE